MSVSSYALLALDTYNRAYGDGITSLVNVNPVEGSEIGEWRIFKQSVVRSDSPEFGSGFYAVAYERVVRQPDDSLLVAERVIAFRGTDNITQDMVTGWVAGGGFWSTGGSGFGSQVGHAVRFYEEVTGRSIFEGPVANLTLTGHSLGGGLAGFVAAMTGNHGLVFDTMPFASLAVNYSAIHNAWIALGNSVTSPRGEVIDTFHAPDASNVKSLHVTGEILQFLRGFVQTLPGLETVVEGQVANLPPLASFSGLPANPGNLHTQSLLVLLNYAREKGHVDWSAAGDALYNALFHGSFVEDVGIKGSDGPDTGRVKLAYSTLHSGERPYGDLGAPTMFGDADQIGSAFSSYNQALKIIAGEAMRVVVENGMRLAASDTQGDLLADTERSNVLSGVVGVAHGVLSLDLERRDGGMSLATGDVYQAIAAYTAERGVPLDVALLSSVSKISFMLGAGALLGADHGSQLVVGSTQADVMRGTSGNDVLLGDLGEDTVSLTASGSSTVSWSRGHGRLVGPEGTDEIRSVERIRFGEADDVVTLNLSYQGLSASPSRLTLDGGGQADGGRDHLDMSGMLVDRSALDFGNNGEYFLSLRIDGFEALTTTRGRDLITLGDTGALSSIRHVDGHEGDDEIRLTGTTAGIEADGGAGRDLLVGSAQADILRGGADADRLIGGLGADVLDGGDGIDTADYSGAASRIFVNLADGTARGLEGALNEADGDVLSNIENVVGTAWNDRIEGDGADNRLEGGAGVDRIRGGGGNDHLVGGESGPLVGSEHLDVAIYGGRWIDYAVRRTVPGTEQFTVTDRRGGAPDGADLVDQFEFFVFEGDGPGTAIRATFVENVAPVRIDLISGGSLAEGFYARGSMIASFGWEDRNAYDQVRSWSAGGLASGTMAAIDDLFQVAWDAASGLMTLQFARDVTLDFETWTSRVANWSQWANGSFAGSVPVMALAGTAYGASLTVTDWSGLSFTRSFAFQVTDVDETPTFAPPDTDDGDGDAALRTFRVAENTSDVGSVAATSGVSGEAVAYALEGADAARFQIDASGRISFRIAPDFEQPTDAGSDNAYDLVVRATSAQASATQAVRVIVQDVNETPVFTDANPLALSLAENSTAALAVPRATDPDAGDAVRYAILGADAALFDVDPVTGAIVARTPLDFENRRDADGDGIHRLTLAATDRGGLTATRQVAITVTDVDESPFAIRWASGGAVPEHSRPGVLVGQVIASDPEGGPLAFSLAAPNDRFTITADGRIWTASANPLALDFETATSEVLAIRATDAAGLSTVASLTVSVTNVAETLTSLTANNDAWSARTSGVNVILARGGFDTVAGGAGDDIILGEGGSDLIFGGAGNDWLLGGDNEDKIYGDAGNDLIDGGEGNDTIFGGAGNDLMFGGGGVDTFVMGEGADTINGGDGVDTADYASSTSALTFDYRTGRASGGDASDDLMSGIEIFIGGSGNDTFIGGNGADVMQGGRGHDVYIGSPGADRIVDTDWATLDYSASDAGVSISTQSLTLSGGHAEGDTLPSDMSRLTVIGSAYRDILTRGSVLIGGAGDDDLSGDSGNQTLVGGEGFDVIRPGSGWDTIDFGSGGGRLSFWGNTGINVTFSFATKVLEIRSSSNGSLMGTSVVGGIFNEFEGGATLSTVTGTDDVEVMRFGPNGFVHFDGRGGDDTLEGYGTLLGGEGNDVITFRGGTTVDGGAGDDVVRIELTGFEPGVIFARGGIGNDRIEAVRSSITVRFQGGEGADTMTGGSLDVLSYEAATSAIHIRETGNGINAGSSGVGLAGEALGDIYTNMGTVYGSAFADTIEGNFQHAIHAGDGDDVIIGSGGLYGIRGGNGDDNIRNLGNSTAWGEAGNDVMWGINLDGGDGNDVLQVRAGFGSGGFGNDILTAIESGVQTLQGGEGNDVFRAGSHADTVIMDGVGADIAYWRRGDGYDTINNFTIGTDKVVIERGSLLDPMPAFRFLASGTTGTQMEMIFLNAGQNPLTVAQSNRHYLTFTGITPNMLSADDFIFM